MSDAAVNPVDAYAQSVVDGAVPAGKYHRLSCARHLRDRAREGEADFPYRFDPELADRFFRFAGKLKHYKGEWAGTFIALQPYQQFRLGAVFGWVHAVTRLRRFRAAYNEIPRKNGKSLEAAVVALYTTFFSGEAGAEGYTIATKREQAKIVFTDAKKLVQSSGLRARIEVQVANLHIDATSSKLEPLGADHDSTDGLNPSLIITDEFHAHKDRGLIDVMETATGARRQPLHFQITTAGDDPVSPCGDQHDYACKILDGILEDETFFAFIAHTDPEDDWLDEATWAKANPNWGVSVNPDDMRALARKAKAMPAAAATFKQKRLNMWVSASAPWLSVEGWRDGQHTEWSAEDLRGETCYVGIDLASKLDLCPLVCVFPPTDDRPAWRLLSWVWTPEDSLKERAHRDRAPYDIWVEQGHLLTTPGTHVDHSVIRDVLVAQRDRFTIAQVGFDPWHADMLIDQLVNLDGFSKDQVVEVPQTYAGMSSAALRLEGAVLDGLVDAGDSPLMSWCASNVVVQRDGKDNIYPVKKRSRGRIDPVVATIIGMSLAIRQTAPAESVYLTRGVRVLGQVDA
jgi:phage terminase large subunit-like protein